MWREDLYSWTFLCEGRWGEIHPHCLFSIFCFEVRAPLLTLFSHISQAVFELTVFLPLDNWDGKCGHCWDRWAWLIIPPGYFQSRSFWTKFAASEIKNKKVTICQLWFPEILAGFKWFVFLPKCTAVVLSIIQLLDSRNETAGGKKLETKIKSSHV